MVREACVVLSLLHTASGKGDDEEGRVVVGRLGSVCVRYCCLIWRCFFLCGLEVKGVLWIVGKREGKRCCFWERDRT